MKEMNFYLFLTNVAVALLCGALLPILPRLTRKSYLFGVQIPLEEHARPEAQVLKKRYTAACLLGAALILSLVVLQYIFFPDITLVSVLYFPLLFVAVQMAAFVPNWKRAKKLKEERKWIVPASVFSETKSSHSRGNLSELPWIWYVLSLIIVFASIIITLIKYPGLPDRIPTHFNFNMQPDAWSDKSLLSVMTMPLINIGTLLIMLMTGIVLVKAKLQIDPQKPTLSFKQHCVYRKRMGNCLGLLALALSGMMALVGFMSLWPNLKIPFLLVLVLLLAPIIPLIVVSVSSGQGGCNIKLKGFADENTGNPYEQKENSPERSADKYWAWGMFYHNPDDPACLVENRFGINFGFNYSRFPVKIGVVISLLLFVASYVWATVLLCAIS